MATAKKDKMTTQYRQVEFKVRRIADDRLWKHILVFSNPDFVVSDHMMLDIRQHVGLILTTLAGNVDEIRWNFSGSRRGYYVSFNSVGWEDE